MTTPAGAEPSPPAGPATDARGVPAVDPSKNTDSLVSAAVVRLDDLAALRSVHADRMAVMDERLRQADLNFLEERDRRLTEVAAEREKALKIKDEGDAKALRIKDEADKEARELAREAQRYKDEQANKLREQISAERGDYVSILAFKPVADYVTAQQARFESTQQNRSDLRLNANLLIAMGGLIVAATILALALR